MMTVTNKKIQRRKVDADIIDLDTRCSQVAIAFKESVKYNKDSRQFIEALLNNDEIRVIFRKPRVNSGLWYDGYALFRMVNRHSNMTSGEVISEDGMELLGEVVGYLLFGLLLSREEVYRVVNDFINQWGLNQIESMYVYHDYTDIAEKMVYQYNMKMGYK